MSLPSADLIHRVVAATWPAASVREVGPWRIRDGRGGGSRVSAATAEGPVTAADLPAAEAAMRDLGQVPLVMVRDGEEALDGMLDAAGYRVMDPVTGYAAPVDAVARLAPPVTVFTVWPPLAAQAEIWAEGGIGPARLAVMDRAAEPKVTLFGRLDDTPAGTVYAGIAEGIVMLHALEIAPRFRRRGLAATLTRAVAAWGAARGATHLALVTTRANLGANALYSGLGMTPVARYHYRIKEGTP